MTIDTNTVNYAVDKISTAVSKAIPTMTSVSKELVSYTVTSQVLTTLMSLLFALVSAIVFIPIYRYFKKNDEFDSPLFILPAVGLGCCFFFSFLLAICTLQSTVLALNYPEMFTAMKLISK